MQCVVSNYALLCIRAPVSGAKLAGHIGIYIYTAQLCGDLSFGGDEKRRVSAAGFPFDFDDVYTFE